jgi:hypothetical protein
MRFSMAQFDPVDFNCTTARAALLPTRVDLAGYRIKKQAQPFAAPGFLGGRHSQAAVISCVVGGFPVLLPIPTIVSPRAVRQASRGQHGSRLLGGQVGEPRRDISLLAQFFLRLPFHLSLGPEIVARLTIAFPTCAGSWKVPSVLFSEKAKAIPSK